MNPAPFEFYFDFSSPYGYFASTQIDALANEFGRTASWHPILLGPIFKQSGAKPVVDVALKGAYALRDFARTAELFDIPYAHPANFPIGTVAAARAMMWIESRHGPAKAITFARKAYHAFFVDGRDIGDTDVVITLGGDAGLDAGQLAEGMQDQAIKDALRKQVEEAMGKGVFGSPFIIVDGEPFWGFDRFDHIRRWLQRRYRQAPSAFTR
ncbi:MAG: 2-hydroxychromene-2-carboxylate isomerase [Candidimonas sp.]|nr:MAG: 2-hydroxychromene-2-carboxylate isomerase [Candidimonas sp.]